MSSINSVRNLQILYFIKKNKKYKKWRKRVSWNPYLYILLHLTKTSCFLYLYVKY